MMDMSGIIVAYTAYYGPIPFALKVNIPRGVPKSKYKKSLNIDFQASEDSVSEPEHSEGDAMSVVTDNAQVNDVTSADIMQAIKSLKHDFHTEISGVLTAIKDVQANIHECNGRITQAEERVSSAEDSISGLQTKVSALERKSSSVAPRPAGYEMFR
ncbi:hypothetical protein DPX16_2182 [Anabarilius grahami]|uniref:Uncharacterized protein n=1 Tax=Anabarilius grahami TaxID=495550 RepID=A0A3N0YEZ2_ANAGA|nr:hypothetical protein DPX16_2182 [Anabarilius grahami]